MVCNSLIVKLIFYQTLEKFKGILSIEDPKDSEILS